MADDDQREDEPDDEPDEVEVEIEAEAESTFDANRFGIDLGRRGDVAEHTSRDEVEPPAVERAKNPVRTLTDRLASAAADRLDGTVESEQDED